MAATVLLKLLTEGIGALQGSPTALFDMAFRSFLIGDSAGFEMPETVSHPFGNLTFTGDSANIRTNYFDDNRSLRIQMIVPEEFTDIKIGNVVLYAFYNGGVVPIAFMILSEPVTKKNPTQGFLGDDIPISANRMVISIIIKYVSEEEIDTEITVNIETPSYTNLSSFGHDTEIPSAASNPWDQFTVDQMDVAGGTPAIVVKTLDDKYFTTPMFQDLDSPMYGILDGTPLVTPVVRQHFLWARKYDTDNGVYGGIVGGQGYEDSGTDYIVGGIGYEE